MTLMALLLFSSGAKAQKYDYVMEEEEDLIRDAQELPKRISLFLQLLDNRVVTLGLRERTAKEREQAKKDLEAWEREAKEADKVKDAELRARPLRPDVYLRNATKMELLNGYIQIVGEIMDNIDDAFDRRLEVRSPVEALEKFLGEQVPRFYKLQTKTPNEAAALKELLEQSEQTIQDCRNALKSLPKTEKKPL